MILDRLLWAIPIVASATLSTSRRKSLAAAARAIAEITEREISHSVARTEMVDRAREIARQRTEQTLHFAASGS